MKKLINLFLGRYLRQREHAAGLQLASIHAINGNTDNLKRYFTGRNSRAKRWNGRTTA